MNAPVDLQRQELAVRGIEKTLWIAQWLAEDADLDLSFRAEIVALWAQAGTMRLRMEGRS